jgi:CubicO group peptidase (beta-lactamase class C family)
MVTTKVDGHESQSGLVSQYRLSPVDTSDQTTPEMMSKPPKLLALAAAATSWMIPGSRADSFDDGMIRRMKELNVRGASVVYYDASKMDAPIIRGYGKIASSDDSQDVTSHTPFQLASISKVFTAATVASLVNQGLIRLDDDICDIIPPDWQQSACRNPAHPDAVVTWRSLSSHTSSLVGNVPLVRNQNNELKAPGYGPTDGYVDKVAAGNPTCPLTDFQGFYRDFLTNKTTETTVGTVNFTVQGGDTLHWYEAGRDNGGAWLDYAPGENWTYSNFAVGYVAALVELVTNRTFDDYSREYIFDPLGMNETVWYSRDLPTGLPEAEPVDFRNGTFSDIGQYCYIDMASGSLRTSAEDIAKWLQAMLTYGAPKLWPESIGRQVFSCQQKNPQGNDFETCLFGLGWILVQSAEEAGFVNYTWLQGYNFTDGVWHDGGEAGVQTHMLVLPSAGLYQAVLTNTYNNDPQAPTKLAETMATLMSGNSNSTEAPAPDSASSSRPTFSFQRMLAMAAWSSLIMIVTGIWL